MKLKTFCIIAPLPAAAIAIVVGDVAFAAVFGIMFVAALIVDIKGY